MPDKYLRRYTDILALTYLLSTRKITFLDPRSWDDSNDSHYLSLYKQKKNLKSVLALCFTQTGEKYHHWRVFAGGPTGVCIRFKRSALLKVVHEMKGIRTGSVEYRTIKQLKARNLAIEKLPFVKRNAFRDEAEYRLIYESNRERMVQFDIPIPLSCIDKVTLSPWAHKSLIIPMKKLLRSIDGCGRLNIVGSTLVDNAKWKTIGVSAR